jgi:predicted DNA binding CopG/RHH family protein
MSKTLAFKQPLKVVQPPAEEWINEGVESHLQPAPGSTPAAASAPVERMKRLTIEVPESLHTRVKVGCAKKGLKISDEVREMLSERFPE